MHTIIRTLAIAAFIACFPAASDAEIVRRLPLSPLAQHWHSGDGSATEIWLLDRGDGSLELHGRDLVSSYGGLVIPGGEDGVWTCTGMGFRFEGGLAFAYRSTFTFKIGDGSPTLTEVWTATLPDGKVIEGTTVLKRVDRPKTE